MKTTIRAHTKDVIVRPSPVAGMIELTLQAKQSSEGGFTSGVCLTADQAGALIFALEQALESGIELPRLRELAL